MEVPALPYANPNNYQHIGRRTAEALRKSEPHGVFFADQWNNLDNRKAHYVSTGPEIWEQTGGEVDGFICSIGTGGTVAGVSEYPARAEEGHRHRHRRSARRGHVQPVLERRGQGLPGRFDHRRHRTGPRHAHHQGHQGGQALLIPDDEALAVMFDLLEHEGLCVGGSTGINVAGAIRLARDLGPGHTIVTILADYGTRYQSKLFNPEFLRSKKLPVPEWLERKVNYRTSFKRRDW